MLNLLLIPKWSAYGAVVASIIAEGTITTLYVRNCKGYLTVKTILECAWKRLLAGLAMCALVMAVGKLDIENSVLKLILQILSGGCFYVAVRYAAKDEMLREMLELVAGYVRKVLSLAKRK